MKVSQKAGKLGLRSMFRCKDFLQVSDKGRQVFQNSVPHDVSKFFLTLPLAKETALSAASRMWRRQAMSSRCILHQGFRQDPLSEISAQILWCSYIHLPSLKHGRQFILHVKKPEKAGCFSSLEFHKHIDVALRSKVIPQGRTEQRKPFDMMTTAEVHDPVIGDFNCRLFFFHRHFIQWVVESAVLSIYMKNMGLSDRCQDRIGFGARTAKHQS